MVSFNDEASLGQVIEKKQIYSFGAAPVTQFKELVFAAGGNKFSSLCGFRFTSKAKSDYREFFVAFVCKLRSKIYRQASANPSQWFIFKKISSKEMHCMDKKSVLVQYGFDVDLFFKSDLFQRGVEKFKQAINKGLKEYVPAYVKAHGAEKAKDLLTSYDGQNEATVADAYTRYTKAIEDSLEYINDLRCNDKFYKLIDYDITVEKDNDVVQEAKFECIVKKDEDGWGVYEKEGNTWVATFQDEIAANEFAKEYPTLKAEYLKKSAAIEAEASLVEDDKLDEAEKEYTFKQLLADLDDFIDTDTGWNMAPVYVQLENGEMYSLTSAGQDGNGEYILLKAGKKANIKKESENVNEANVLDDFLNIRSLERIGVGAYPHNKTGWMDDQLAGVVNGKLVDFPEVEHVKPNYPGEGTFFLLDGSDASRKAFEQQRQIIMGEKEDEQKSEEAKEAEEKLAAEKELDADIEEALKEIYN